ncbi:MAG: twin-arginine translocation signal domain-containing protein [Chloroflexi bacterium]|nr:twin-arginine translocation signal domain-containing protein [Chloroflexota bacterium]
MPDNDGSANEQSTQPVGAEPAEESARPVVTRRDFIAGAGLGVAATAIVAGGVAVATRQNVQTAPQPVVQTNAGGAVVQAPAPAPNVAAQPQTQGQSQAQPQAQGALPLHMRRVTLNIDGINRDVVVDVRESLWATTTQKLGLNGINLGCDRAQCGACTVVIDGRAVNGCSVYSARLGRGQKIQTVASLQTGPGVEGLHPIQRAFWMQGGFQCGICTRGFMMSSYALLTANPSPTRQQIAEGLSGNICRCGEYVKVYDAVEAAAAEMKNPPAQPQVLLGPPPPHTGNPATASYQFVNPLGSDEFIGEVNNALVLIDGVNGVSGNATTATVSYWPDQVNEDQIRKAFSDAGYPVK